MPRTVSQLVARIEARAQVEPAFADALEALVDAPPGGAGGYTRAAALELNSLRRRDALEEFRAGSLNTTAVQALLGLGTPQAVHRLRSRGKLIGSPIGNATWFPSWQFSEGRLRPELPRVLELLGRFTDDAVASDRAMRLLREDLGGQSIATALGDPVWAPAAWAALAELAA